MSCLPQRIDADLIDRVAVARSLRVPLYQLGIQQHLDMLGNSRLRQWQALGYVRATTLALAVSQNPKDLQSNRMTKRPEAKRQ